jgi:hypothetical protein
MYKFYVSDTNPERKEGDMTTENPLTEEDVERLRKQIDAADVSEAAKEFYREHLLANNRTFGGWGEYYPIIKELDEAGLIKTMLVFCVHDLGVRV